MSYILDALKKSEEQRNQQEQVATFSVRGKKQTNGNQSLGRYIFIAFIAMVVAAAAWWFWPTISKVLMQARSSSNVAQSAEQQALATSSQNTTQQTLSQAQSGGGMAKQGNQHVAQQSSQTTVVASADAPLPPGNQIKDLWELPVDFQSQIPSFDFSFHVYSKKPENRTIIINGRRLREGAMVTSKIKLRMITKNGVIMHADGRFFHIDVYEKMVVPNN